MALYKKDQVVRLKSRGGKWIIVEVFPPNRYKIIAFQNNDIIVKNCVVEYKGKEYVVVGRIDAETLSLRNEGGFIINVKESLIKLIRSNIVIYNNEQYTIEEHVGNGMVKLRSNNGSSVTVPAKTLEYVTSGKGYSTGQQLEVHEEDIELDEILAYQLSVFTSYSHFTQKMDSFIENIEPDSDYEENLKGVEQRAKDRVEEADDFAKNWYGEPFPSSVQDMIDRKDFQKMDEYNDFKVKFVKPLLAKLKLKSFAHLFFPKLRYNEMEIGMFDFGKASANLLEKYQYYSIKHKKTVDFSEVKLIHVKFDVYEYKLKNDDSKVVIVPVFDEKDNVDLHEVATEIEKTGSVLKALHNLNLFEKTKKYSTIRKSYLAKEKIVRPKSAVRLFSYVGASCGITANQIMFSSMVAIAATEILEAIGYAVNLNAIMGYEDFDRESMRLNRKMQNGCRGCVFPIKSFDETLYVPRALYIMADATHFRYKLFRYYVGMFSHFQDLPSDILKYPINIENAESMCFHRFLPIDKQKGILYLFLGNKFEDIDWEKPMDEIIEEARNQALQQIKEMVLTCEQSNQQAREIYFS